MAINWKTLYTFELDGTNYTTVAPYTEVQLLGAYNDGSAVELVDGTELKLAGGSGSIGGGSVEKSNVFYNQDTDKFFVLEDVLLRKKLKVKDIVYAQKTGSKNIIYSNTAKTTNWSVNQGPIYIFDSATSVIPVETIEINVGETLNYYVTVQIDRANGRQVNKLSFDISLSAAGVLSTTVKVTGYNTNAIPTSDNGQYNNPIAYNSLGGITVGTPPSLYIKEEEFYDIEDVTEKQEKIITSF